VQFLDGPDVAVLDEVSSCQDGQPALVAAGDDQVPGVGLVLVAQLGGAARVELAVAHTPGLGACVEVGDGALSGPSLTPSCVHPTRASAACAG
jgi:hypothetical protein